MSDPTDVLLIGLGSIGTVYAYLLERSGKARVTAVARSNYDVYANNGVSLVTDRFGTIQYKPYRVFKSQEEALADGTKYALCVVATKSLPDVLPTPTLLAPSIASDQVGAYVLIQNGLGVETDLHKAAPSTPIVSCLAWISTTTSQGGSVVTWKGADKLGCGVYPPPSDQRVSFSAPETHALELWTSLLKDGGAAVVQADNIESMRYSKNVLTASWAGLQGLARTQAACFAGLSAAHHAQIKKYQREIISLGFKTGLLVEGMTLQPMGNTAEGVEETIEADFNRFVLAPQGSPVTQHKWSLLVDIENDRPFEVEVILGSVVRLAQSVGHDTPLVDFAYTVLSGVQASILAKRQG
ncbi:uncharacterized protein EHS24_003670 [Apiotrichum porosum]|uniref:2-dehydropantoate 2-reductase n=1 Tax=Apiotrichum porosum TaxID=105984 RepID=A0A427XEA1_9TREE|nr:uncharacterized protein EHS24_003670 [Apiotrichum porosum]RSH77047.1 hypothetical protein EHS24_003670 [Apiotrichum porosum]